MKKPTILIIDDEKDFTGTFANFLSERFNGNVLVRDNAIEGIKVLNQQRVDVLFQDMVLPGPGGEQVLKHVKNIKRINRMIVFIISKWDDKNQTLKFENYDLKYIPKPVSLITTQKVLMEEFEHCGGFDYKKKGSRFALPIGIL